MQATPPEIDDIVSEALPLCAGASASVAIVQDGRIMANAYGPARRSPDRPATPQTRYAIGSVAKQFTAAAALLLEREGTLSLDEPLSRWLSWPTGADRVTVRALLSHTAGYVDYYSHRHAPPAMLGDTTPMAVGLDWGRRSQEFQPGEDWRYSNTGYVLAGLVLEKAAGATLSDLLQRRLFAPLCLAGARAYEGRASRGAVAQPLTRVGLAAARPALTEGVGWLFGAAGLAMRAYDLALWNRALLACEAPVDGLLDLMAAPVAERGGRRYGLGLGVAVAKGRRVISHGGQVQGFLAENRVYPDLGLAITVLTNTDAGAGCADIADRLALSLAPPADASAAVLEVFDTLRSGRLEAPALTEGARRLFSPATLGDFSASLQPLGPVRQIELAGEVLRGGMAHRQYEVTFGQARLMLRVAVLADGRIDELLASAHP